MTSRSALLAALLGLTGLALSACSGSGGGGGQPPQIVTAALVASGGSGTDPGDLLVLTFSRPVQVVSVLDDADVVLSAGSLGTITMAPISLSAHTVSVTLGVGVSLTPATTTITFDSTNDSIQAVDGAFGNGGPPRTISIGDGSAPFLPNLTLNGIEDELNGDGAAGGTLQVPRSGFTIDISHADPSTIDTSRTFVTSDRSVSVAGVGTLSPGDNLVGDLVLLASSNITVSTYSVPSNVVFGSGPQSLTAIVTDATGMSSAPMSFSFVTMDATADSQPFEAPQVWFLDLSRDVEDFDNVLTILDGANGTADIEDLFESMGLLSLAPIVIGGGTSNDVVMQIIRDELLTELDNLFSGVNLSFTFTSPGTFPGGPSAATTPFVAGGFSQMCIAGAADNVATGVLGSALFDSNNRNHDNNCLTTFGAGNARLGVFPHAALRLGFQTGASSLFRLTFDPFTPARSGIPIGDMTGDDARLAEVQAGTNTGSDPRITSMDTALIRMARLLAIITAHECGHSMGLVTNGPMPGGLYGDDAANFPLSGMQPPTNASGHIQNTSLFPVGSQNVMSPAINFEAAQTSFTAFNTLNLAYLRQRAIYVPN